MIINPNDKTPIPFMVIRGTIVSSEEALSENWDRKALRSAFFENSLQVLYLEGSWGVGGISFNSSVPVEGRSNSRRGIGKYAAAKKVLKFANKINNIVQTDKMKELCLDGFFDITIDSGHDMIVARVDITQGEVSYHQAELVWPELTVLPRCK